MYRSYAYGKIQLTMKKTENALCMVCSTLGGHIHIYGF